MTSDKNRKKRVNRKIVTHARRLALEKLQSRELLAGDVTAAVTNGFLVVRGDDAANELTIERISGDRSSLRRDGNDHQRTDPAGNSQGSERVRHRYGWRG